MAAVRTKRFKLRLMNLPSLIQLCRSSNQTTNSRTSKTPKSFFSPINPKTLEISYPSFPDPPPPTPNLQSKLSQSFSFASTIECNSPHKMCNSPAAAFESNDENYNNNNKAWCVTPSKPRKTETKRRKRSTGSSISSGESGWFSSDEDFESLISSSENLDSSCDFTNSVISTSTTTWRKNNTSGNVKCRRLQHYVSNSWRSGGGGGESPVRKGPSVFRKLMSMGCVVEGKVNESFAVVTNSENPYEDFKRSMTEMILEKQMFEAKDLEQLLQCFLSLNSRHHHAVIVEAFSEIWEVMFM